MGSGCLAEKFNITHSLFIIGHNMSHEWLNKMQCHCHLLPIDCVMKYSKQKQYNVTHKLSIMIACDMFAWEKTTMHLLAVCNRISCDRNA